jgi:hypothetical protein
MKNAIALVILVMGMLLLPVRPAAAAYVTTEELERNCLSHKADRIEGCLQYIAGVIDYHVLMQSLGTQPTIDFCLPDKLTIEDAALAVMAYLRVHPQHDAFIASAAVPMALHAAYPCQAPAPRKHRHRRS